MDETRFRNCVLPLHRRLFAYALVILGDEDEAADCIQEAFTRLWEARDRLDDVGDLFGYAKVAVRNTALSMLTQRQRLQGEATDNDRPDPTPGPEEMIESDEQLRRIASGIRQLPDNQRRVISMSAFAGLSNPEIQQATGLSPENVRVLLSRARKSLRRLIATKK
ncbi:MAG: sigma-70 family RNA polymerase sigma factor [Bacteroides sp.]|nr:sigma-70 family RNA polymerase sigma factor [Bacteroides sp.]